MPADETPIENSQKRIAVRIGEWLLREREEGDQNDRLYRLSRMNVILSFLTLCAVVGVEGARDLISIIPYL